MLASSSARSPSGVAHLVAGLANPDASPVLAIGEATIELHFRLVSGIRDAFRG